MTGTITGLTRGGAEWTPQFITALDAQKCIGCGRCYKVCPRDVFTLVDRGSVVEADDDYDDDDEMQVMSIQNGLDCIGCTSCSRVCPKQCHSHQFAAA
ncbi:ferredoxin III, nif-specific [Pseudomonas sp. XS1P51]